MLIRELEILNCRKVKQAAIQFHGPGLQVIQGMNQSGKSTIAQAIQLTIEGTKAFTPGMITLGESQAEVLATTDDGLKIRTQMSGDKVKQTVSRIDETTGRYVALSGGVREFLNSIRSGLELPWAMRDWTDAKIIELLKDKTGLTEKITEIDAAIRTKETARTETGRDVKRFGTLDPVEEAEHPDPVDSIQAEREKAKTYIDFEKDLYNRASDYVRKFCDFHTLEDIAALRRVIDSAEKKISAELSTALKTAGRAYNQDDLEAIESQLAEWVEAEQKAKNYDDYLVKKEQLEKLNADYAALTGEIESLREQRKKSLASMKLVKGLEIGEDNLLYHNGNVRGITDTNRVGNWSTAESVKVFFSIGSIFSGELKVLVVDNAESLDGKTTGAISAWAEKEEFLVILLKVADVPEELEEGIIYVREGEVIKA
jgi:chromosome segregation ATPase